MKTAIIALVVSLALAGPACADEDGGSAPAETRTFGQGDPTPARLVDYSPTLAGGLLLAGRDRLRVCVDTVGIDGLDAAVSAIGDALLRAMDEDRWRPEFDDPEITAGCPLGPRVLEGESYCDDAAGQFLVHVFAGSAAEFEEAFPAEVVANSFPIPGLRRAGQETLSSGNEECVYAVTEAWYITPEELEDQELLEGYIFGIFSIAEIPE